MRRGRNGLVIGSKNGIEREMHSSDLEHSKAALVNNNLLCISKELREMLSTVPETKKLSWYVR